MPFPPVVALRRRYHSKFIFRPILASVPAGLLFGHVLALGQSLENPVIQGKGAPTRKEVLPRRRVFRSESTSSMPSSRGRSRTSAKFDDDRAAADARLAILIVLSEKLDLKALAKELLAIHPFRGRQVASPLVGNWSLSRGTRDRGPPRWHARRFRLGSGPWAP